MELCDRPEPRGGTTFYTGMRHNCCTNTGTLGCGKPGRTDDKAEQVPCGVASSADQLVPKPSSCFLSRLMCISVSPYPHSQMSLLQSPVRSRRTTAGTISMRSKQVGVGHHACVGMNHTSTRLLLAPDDASACPNTTPSAFNVDCASHTHPRYPPAPLSSPASAAPAAQLVQHPRPSP